MDLDSRTLDLQSLAAPRDESWRAELARLLRQALPNIGTTIMRMMMTFVDFAMVSKLGTDAQAAVSPSSMFVFIVVALGMAIATTVTVFSAQALGRRDHREGSAYAWQCVYLSVVLTMLCPLLMWAMPGMFGMFDHVPAVRDMEIAYCRIGVWSITPSVVAAGLEGFFNGIKRPVIGFVSICAALLIHIIGNYLLIGGLHGFPKMGIAGAALSAVLGWWARAAILLFVFLRRPTADRFYTRETWRYDKARMRNLVSVGAPTSVQWVLDIGAWFLFMTYLMGQFGKEAMAAANTCMQYMHLSFMPSVGIAIALCALVGHAIGEGRNDLAVRRVRIALVLVMVYMAAAAILFVSAPRWLMSLFTSDAKVIAFGAHMLLWTAAFQVWDGVGMVYNNALRGAGDTRWPTYVFVCTSWGIFIGGGTLLLKLWPAIGINGPWSMCTLYIVVLGMVLAWRFHRGEWKKIKLFDTKPSAAATMDDVPPDPACT